MAEDVQTRNDPRPMDEVFREIRERIESQRHDWVDKPQTIKDLRWKFDQISARMNQAIYNDQPDRVHETCLGTIAVLTEILARS